MEKSEAVSPSRDEPKNNRTPTFRMGIEA